MRSEEAKRKRIIEAALRLFMAHGFSRVSMDEIARNAGVGKGTIYQLFDSKQTLMLSAIDSFGGQMEEVIGGVLTDSDTSPIEKLQLFLKTVSERLSHIRPDVLREVEVNFPEAFEKIQQVRYRIIFTNLTGLLRDGKQFGIYDPEMNETLVAHVVIGAVDHIIQARVLSSLDCPLDQVFRSVISIILKGCLAEEYRNTVN